MKRLQILIDGNDEPFVFPREYTHQHASTVSRLGEAYTSMVREQYLQDTPHLDSLSSSQIGKPAIMLAWNKFVGYEQPPASFALKRKWLGGHMFELEVMFWLDRLGYKYEWQPTIDILGVMSGHPDFIVEGEEGKFIVECKHVGASNYKAMKKGMYNKGYITQFSLYCTHYQCGGLWVVGNADTGEMMYIAVPTYADVVRHYQSYIVDAMSKHKLLTEATSFDEAVRAGAHLPLPTNRADGTHGIIPELYSSKGVLHPVCQLYSIEVVDGRPNVVALNYPYQLKEVEPKWEK